MKIDFLLKNLLLDEVLKKKIVLSISFQKFYEFKSFC